MKKLLIAAMAVLTVASCSKHESAEPIRDLDPETTHLSLSFTNTTEPGTRAFFDAVADAEVWEKKVTAISVFVFDDSRNLLLRRNLTDEEIRQGTAMFSLPRSVAGKNCEFWVVANKNINAASYSELSAMIENNPGVYNDTEFSTVAGGCKRPEGFVMSGQTSKKVAAAGQMTEVSVVLKRNVSKIAVQTSASPMFTGRYPGTLTIKKVSIRRAANQTLLFQGTPGTSNMSFTFDQNTKKEGDNFNNLFYVYENSALAIGSRVMALVTAEYNGHEYQYEVELDGAGDGSIIRNGYYRVELKINGLSGKDIDSMFIIADWDNTITQQVGLGN